MHWIHFCIDSSQLFYIFSAFSEIFAAACKLLTQSPQNFPTLLILMGFLKLWLSWFWSNIIIILMKSEKTHFTQIFGMFLNGYTFLVSSVNFELYIKCGLLQLHVMWIFLQYMSVKLVFSMWWCEINRNQGAAKLIWPLCLFTIKLRRRLIDSFLRWFTDDCFGLTGFNPPTATFDCSSIFN